MEESIYKKIFSENLRYYMSINNKSQIDLINDLKLNRSAVSTWCNGTRLPRMDKVDLLAKYFGITQSDLLEERSSKNTNSTNAVSIPVLGRVAAGIPINAITEIIDTEEIPEDLAKTGDFFALQIQGDSMEPKISNGDVVIVRQQDDAETGDTVIALINGDDAVCKRLRKYKEGLELISTNPSYSPLYFDEETIKNKPVRIIGKVIELRAKF